MQRVDQIKNTHADVSKMEPLTRRHMREKGKLNKSTGNDSANKEPKLLHEREVGNFNKPIPTQICR